MWGLYQNGGIPSPINTVLHTRRPEYSLLWMIVNDKRIFKDVWHFSNGKTEKGISLI
jgi:hypothetical protein